jgi:hypothetical protein
MLHGICVYNSNDAIKGLSTPNVYNYLRIFIYLYIFFYVWCVS